MKFSQFPFCVVEEQFFDRFSSTSERNIMKHTKNTYFFFIKKISECCTFGNKKFINKMMFFLSQISIIVLKSCFFFNSILIILFFFSTNYLWLIQHLNKFHGTAWKWSKSRKTLYSLLPRNSNAAKRTVSTKVQKLQWKSQNVRQ